MRETANKRKHARGSRRRARPFNPGTLAFVVGTRPEAVKLSPVILAARSSGLAVAIVSTGQHPEAVRTTLAAFGLAPDIELPPLRNRELSGRCAQLLSQMDRFWARARPAVVVVQGDTMSAFAGALAAYHRQIPVAHVEAGLRSGCLAAPFPEEAYRQAIARIASIHFAPTPAAQRQLVLEGIAADRIFLTGNAVVDAVRLLTTQLRPEPTAPTVDQPYYVVTAHRRENYPEGFRVLAEAMVRVHRACPHVRWVVVNHPNGWFAEVLRLLPEQYWQILAPLNYPQFIQLLQRAEGIVTDSGGLQEEACCLEKPTLVVRHHTERSEGIEAGWCRLVSPDDLEQLEQGLFRLVNRPWSGVPAERNPFGDGYAADRIVLGLKWLLADRVAARTNATISRLRKLPAEPTSILAAHRPCRPAAPEHGTEPALPDPRWQTVPDPCCRAPGHGSGSVHVPEADRLGSVP